jgi:hypothetical protein
MVDMATINGGSKVGVSSLSASEHQAAINALAKLSGSSGGTKGVSSVFGGTFKNATVSSGTAHADAAKTASGTTLVSGKGADTFAGGVHSAAAPAVKAVGSDTVVAGSAFGKTELAAGSTRALTGDTISVAGTTAAGVKTTPEVKAGGQTITMADKTSITLTGVTAHNTAKPH